MNKCVFLFLSFIFFAQLDGNQFQVVKDGPWHEAYVIQEYGTLLIESVPNQPPQKIQENQPQNEDAQAIWIPGYWAWSRRDGQFLWVSGVWRRPPPNHQWISGYWKQSGSGWVWMRGFWSHLTEDSLVYLEAPPPDPIDEHIPDLPSSIGDFFWVPGYWDYQEETKNYVWLSGLWVIPQKNWVYVPPQYIWRGKGYVMNPAFWDWPLDVRGVVFNALNVSLDAIDTIIYDPTESVQPMEMLQMLFPYWPNYFSLFHYSYYFHREVWDAWGAAPPWWNWPTWWCYAWPDNWWLWWWWSHPGYPNPYWLDANIASIMTPPPPFIVKFMAHIQVPVNVTPNGVVGLNTLLKAYSNFSGFKTPVLPADPKQIVQIQELAMPQTSKTPYLQPHGKSKPETAPLKIFFGPKHENFDKIKMPELPQIPKKENQNREELSQSTPTPVAPQTPLPTHTPQSNRPLLYSTPEAERPIPQTARPQQRYPVAPRPDEQVPLHETVPSPLVPESEYEIQSAFPQPYENPQQGYPLPPTRHQLTPMQTEHHDIFMGHPQPQVNPEGPKAYQVPGDYSTLPQQ